MEPEPRLQRIESVALSERVYESLRAAIVRCELAPGEIIRDRELPERLGVSRTPIREALYRLAAIGLVSSNERGTWIVAPMTEGDLHELFELRRSLEPIGLDRMAEGLDEAAVEKAAASFDAYGDSISVEEYPGYFAVDREFHRRLVALSGNRRAQRFYEVIESEIDRGRHFLSTGWHGRVDDTLDEHRAVCAALRAGDIATARAELLRHLNTGEKLMTALLHHRQPGKGQT